MTDRLKIKANAKINIGLDILGKREDGYHDIRTLMHSVSLGDILVFEKSGETEVVSDLGIDPKEDITYKAIEAVRNYAGVKGSLKASVTKRIPTGAGLGGGSADGAAAIRAFDILYGLGLSGSTMESIALSVGSDLPFLISGGCALCEGRGEIMTRHPSFEGTLLIVKGDTSVSTKEAYAFMDSVGLREQNDFSLIEKALAEHSGFRPYNAFELYMDRIAPGRTDVKKILLESGAYAAGLSGSGACYWGLYEDGAAAERAREALSDRFAFAGTACLTERSIEISGRNGGMDI